MVKCKCNDCERPAIYKGYCEIHYYIMEEKWMEEYEREQKWDEEDEEVEDDTTN